MRQHGIRAGECGFGGGQAAFDIERLQARYRAAIQQPLLQRGCLAGLVARHAKLRVFVEVAGVQRQGGFRFAQRCQHHAVETGAHWASSSGNAVGARPANTASRYSAVCRAPSSGGIDASSCASSARERATSSAEYRPAAAPRSVRARLCRWSAADCCATCRRAPDAQASV